MNSIAGDLVCPACLLPARPADVPLTDSELFALPSMAPVRKALDAEFDRYIQAHKADLPNETIGVGTSFDFQLFDREQLYSPDTRFVLAGIVNRMDRAYVSEANCGEIRLIYRLTRTDVTDIGDKAGDDAPSPRLPMTLNLVLKAKADNAIDSQGKAVTCAEIARRWLASDDWSADGRGARSKTDIQRWSAGSNRARQHRAHRDQSPDRACAEIADPRFPHRLSAEGV